MKNQTFKRLLVILLTIAMLFTNFDVASASSAVKTAQEETSAVEETTTIEGTTAVEETNAVEENSTIESTTTEKTTEGVKTATVKKNSVTENIIAGDETISSNGTYTIQAGATGTITISATNVTLIGQGTDSGKLFNNLSIVCTNDSTKLTLEDVGIASPVTDKNTIDFTGTGNYLYLAGTNLIDKDTNMAGFAMIHVDSTTELTIDDAAGDDQIGVLYFYKREQGAGIGGDNAEVNGKITINGGIIFGKGSKQGAVIGTGADTAGSTPGDITINGGQLSLIANARGALIGGSAGSTGGTTGGKVRITGGTLTLNIDFSGAAIGGGGFDAGNDAAGGQLIVTGGSVRTYIDTNAVSSWSSYGVTQAGVNDAAITAEKLNANEEAVALLSVDTAGITADKYSVKVDGEEYKVDGLHQYRYVNEDTVKDGQTTITDTKSNWTTLDDSNLYLYVTKEMHTVTVNGVELYYQWNEETQRFNKGNIFSTINGKGNLNLSSSEVNTGDNVTIQASPEDGYYLAQVRMSYETADKTVTTVLNPDNGGNYSFVKPEGLVKVYGDFISISWDGTIDLTWYDETKSTYKIQYAAQLAGVAALDNGIFNNYPMVVNSADNTVPHTDENGHPYGYQDTFYNEFKASEDSTDSTVVVGDCELLKAICSTGSTGGNNLVTTNDYWYGGENFAEKIILLTADLDMGGTYTGDKTVGSNWSGPMYMPIAGQYSMNPSNGYTKLGSSFNGTFDGQGHMVYGIYCSRHASSYGDSQSIGLIGRMGVHDNDPKDLYANVVVKNVAVDGYIYGNRSIGAVVGKNGKSTSSLIENCINFATVTNTDSKGCGGIVGAGWNSLTIKNCANFGYIYTSYKNAGGISGSCEAKVYNCYNLGYVNSSSVTQAQAMGTNNGGSSWTNCYWLTGSCVSNQAVYSGSASDTIKEVASADDYKSTSILTSLCNNGRAWVLSSEQNIASAQIIKSLKENVVIGKDLTAYNAVGVVVPRVFTEDNTIFSGFTWTGKPKTDYIEGQTFDAKNLIIWAHYDDGTKEAITDYTITYQSEESAIGLADSHVVVSGTYAGQDYHYSYSITVTANAVDKISITTKADSLLYATGESFDTKGMVIKATYTNGIVEAITDYTIAPDSALNSTDTEVTISYTFRDKTVTAQQEITVLDSMAPSVSVDETTKIKTATLASANDLIWFANQVNAGLASDMNAVLNTDIDLSTVDWNPIGNASTLYTGTFDGNNKTVTLGLTASKSYTAFIGYLGTGGVVKDLTVNGTVTTTSSYTAGIVARSENGKIFNCVNKANITITGTTSYGAGILGYAMGECIVENCENQGEINSAGQYNGGIVGYSSGGVNMIKSCSNSGKVNVTATTTSSTYGAGGIIGSVKGKTTVVGCSNSGEVIGFTYQMGGIVGILGYSASKIENCYNTGAVNNTYNNTNARTGGISGYVSSSNAAIINSYNTGIVKGDALSSNTGSVAGMVANAALPYISNTYGLVNTNANLLGKATNVDTYAKFVTAEELQADQMVIDLGKAFTKDLENVNSGYPILQWHTISFDVNGGDTLNRTSIKVNYDAAYGVLPTTTRTGYTFAGWYTAQSEGSEVTQETICAGDATVYARWTANEYTLSFNTNEEDISNPDSIKVNYGLAYGTLPTVTRTGYTLVGWYTAQTEGTQITEETICTGDVTVYARWILNEYTISFDANGGNTPSKTNIKVNYKAAYGTLPTVTRTGYTFTGWYSEQGEGTQVNEETICTGNATVYARWSVNKYTISFNANGGNTPSKTSIKVNYKAAYGTLPTVTRTGYTFTGWYSKQGEGTQINEKTICTGNATVYARWSVNKYTISFNANGGNTPSKTSIKVNYKAAYGTLPTVTRTGYTFTGWYSAKTGGSAITTKTVCTGSKTVYARWSVSSTAISSVENTSTGVKVTWKSVASASTYRVYRKTGSSSTWTRIKILSGKSSTTYTDISAKSGTTYIYMVKVLDRSEVSSAYSNEKTIRRLSSPTVKVSTVSTSLKVSWNKISGATGYYVYRKTTNSSWEKIAKISKSSTITYTDKQVSNGTKYTYAVRAYYGSSISSYISKSTYYVTLPSIKTLTRTSTTAIKVKWSKNTKATGYQIQYSTSSKFSSVITVKVSGASSVSKSISKLTKNKKYYVRIRAYKTASGKNYYSSWSGIKSVK